MFTKTIFTALACAFVAGSAMAAPSEGRVKIGSDLKSDLTGKSLTGVQVAGPADRNKVMAKEPADVITDVIYTAEGERRYYRKSCEGFYLYYGTQLGGYEADDMTAEIVFGEDGDVYFKNILSTAAGTNSYVKGTLDGDQITVQLPQTVKWIENDPEYGSYGINVDIMAYQIDVNTDAFYYYHYTQKTDITFTLLNNGTIIMENLGDELMLGYSYTDDGVFCGYADTAQTYYPISTDFNTIPEGVTLEDYAIISGDFGYTTKVGFDGDKVYFRGLAENMPEGIVIGTLKDGKVTVTKDQQIGIYSAYLLHTLCGTPNPAYDPYDQTSYEPRFLYSDGDFVMNYDAEKKSFSPVNSDEYLLLVAYLPDDYIYPVFALGEFVLAPHYTYAGTPMNPSNVKYYAISEFGGYNALTFDFSCIAKEGNLLDVNNLAYIVYVNNIVYKFKNSGQAYQGIPAGETWSEIPYTFSNDLDIYTWSNQEREVDFYFENDKSVGVQFVYRYDDEEIFSDRVTYDIQTGNTIIEPVSVSTIAAEDVAGVEFFDLSGRRISNPEKGMFIKRTNAKNGNSIVEKVIK